MPIRTAVLLLALALSGAAAAQVKIGLMVSATGPTTAIGIPQKNTGDILPRKIGEASVEYIQYDDGGDTTRAVQNVKKLLQEHNVDAIIGPSTTPNALAMLDFIAEGKVPLLATVGTSAVVEPLDAKKRWVFKTTQNDDLIAAALVRHMVRTGVKTYGFIGFKDPYGENWYRVFAPMAEKAGIRLVATEYYLRTDSSVTGQALKLMLAKPEAILIAGVGGPAVLPQMTLRDQGYKGAIYQTHGVATDDFIRLGKDRVEGTILAAGPMLVIDEIRGREPGQEGRRRVHRRLREAVRPEAGDLRREHLGLWAHPAAGDSRRARERQTRNRGFPGRAARRDRAGARDRRLPGRVQHEPDQPQRDGRARPGAGDGEGRQVPAASRVIVGVLLAAGRATRFGGAKLLTPLGGAGDTVGAVACRNLRTALPRTVAVVRPGDGDLAAALRQEGSEVIECPDAERGMGRSLAFAVATAGAADGWVVALGDMPWVQPATVRAVAAALAAGADVVAPWHRGRRGHPVGFGRACLPALLALDGDEGARHVVAAWAGRALRIDVDDPGCLLDVDRPDDLAAPEAAPR